MNEDNIKKWQSVIGFTGGDVDGDFGKDTLSKSIEVAKKAGINVNPPEPKPDSKTKWFIVAEKEIGVKEKVGGENKRILEYLQATDIGHPGDLEDETPWCSAFVNWCLKQAGITGTKSAWAQSFADWGKKINPRIGAIVVFRWSSGSGHVGFISDWDSSGVNVLGGNQGDQVCKKRFSWDNVIAIRWPNNA
jgi:uncharacterized protein (TIGR02594 family)